MDGKADTSSNQFWEKADNYTDWEISRPLLFRPDMRQTFFHWFRIKPGDKVLEGGCATGVLTRYIAEGLISGTATGFDISQSFVNYGNKKIAEQGISHKARLVCEDGFALSFSDNTFDAVVNHTYLGVLSDSEAGLKEMIRVCKVGGAVSASISARDFPSIHWAGDSSFGKEDRLNALKAKHEAAYRKVMNPVSLKQDACWNSYRYPSLFANCGLINITIHPYASGFSYNDSYWSDEYKKARIQADIGREIELLEEEQKAQKLSQKDFAAADYKEISGLYREKQEYFLANIDNGGTWEWDAQMHYIVAGTKV